jgi:NitT/TauT family transport system substrate-binding protein
MSHVPGRVRRANARRTALVALTGVATLTLVLTACSGAAPASSASTDASADCETMTPVSIMMGTSDMDVSYTPYATLPMQLGYFADECLDVTVSTTGGSVTTAQALTSGTTDIAMSSPDNLIIAADSEPLPLVTFYNLIPSSIYTLAVLPDSDIEDFGDLAGKTIGLTAASPLYEAYLTARLEDAGLSYADVTTAAIGYGATPMEALKSGEIDAFLAWPGLWASYENAGYDFRLLDKADWQGDYYGIGLAATTDYVEQNPDVLEGISRGVAKASVWLQSDENADEAVRMFWEEYPERAPLPGDDEDEALAKDRKVLDATRDVMGITTKDADTMWGAQSKEKWEAQAQFDLDFGVISNKVDTSALFTNEYNDAANDFDRSTITG